MTKADLIDEVSRLAELTRKDSEVIVETIFDSVVRSLRAGDKIEIRGFGSFRTRQRKPRVGRKMKDDQILPLANGKVWTGQEALPLKLIDQIGDFRAAVEDTAKSVGIKGEPTLVHPEKDRKSLLDLLFGDLSEYLPDRAKLMQTNVGFYYLWK